MKSFFIIILFIFIYKNAYSTNLFETSFYEVEFKSENIEEDKTNNINEIKFKSILNIFKKILINKDYNYVKKNISLDFINSLIKNIIVNDEKIINNKYYSNIKVNYNKDYIVDYLRKKKFSYIEYYPEKFLLIFFDNNHINEILFSKKNKFYSYFQNYNRDYPLLKIPNLDVNDRYILKKDDLINLRMDKIMKFSKKYNTNDIIILFTEYNKNDNKNDNNTLIVISDGKIIEKKFSFNSIFLEKFFQYLEDESINMWKKLNKIQNSSLNFISCDLNYYNLLELKTLRKKLKNISTIENLAVKSLSNKSIKYDISYYGQLSILTNLLIINDLSINITKNTCVIKLK